MSRAAIAMARLRLPSPAVRSNMPAIAPAAPPLCPSSIKISQYLSLLVLKNLYNPAGKNELAFRLVIDHPR